MTTNESRVASAQAIATRIITCPKPEHDAEVWARRRRTTAAAAAILPGPRHDLLDSGTTVFCASKVIGSTTLSPAAERVGRVGGVVDLVELPHRPQGEVQVPAQDQRHDQAGHQDAEELADQELPAVHRLAHQGDAVRPSISSLIDMLAASTPNSTGGEHDDVEADLLHHLVVVAEREVRDDDGARSGRRRRRR